MTAGTITGKLKPVHPICNEYNVNISLLFALVDVEVSLLETKVKQTNVSTESVWTGELLHRLALRAMAEWFLSVNSLYLILVPAEWEVCVGLATGKNSVELQGRNSNAVIVIHVKVWIIDQIAKLYSRELIDYK